MPSSDTARFDAGERPHFLPETRSVRESTFTVAPLPADLQDRRVEITGHVNRKMIINALNSGASVFMVDFENSNSPTWENVVLGEDVSVTEADLLCVPHSACSGTRPARLARLEIVDSPPLAGVA